MAKIGYIEQVILGEEKGFFSWVFRGLTWPFSILYRVGLGIYLWLYDSGLRKKHRLAVPVISIGNITFGGTGKTPAVEKICRMITDLGKSAVVLSRGHGGKASGPVVVSDGRQVLSSVDECGDEPVALAQSLPGVPIVVAKDRRAGGKLACERFHPSAIVLDDGFQYWQLHRDLDIVVVDASRPFGSGYVMPMGDLREPIRGLRRAHVVLVNVTAAEGCLTDGRVGRVLSTIAPKAELFACRRKPRRLLGPHSSAIDLEWLRGRRVVGFCGIGSPTSFFSTLASLGAVVCESIVFPDHHVYSEADIKYIVSRSAAHAVDAIITTCKDVVRLEGKSAISNLYVLEIELEIDGEDRLERLVKDVLDRAS
ncbi:MAG: tetraacyldisaccharide 4'-kinase [Armatimonadota bacterium]|nr:tetraacyldisaccharide 4'-kinase [Armatimonadota bacterium]